LLHAPGGADESVPVRGPLWQLGVSAVVFVITTVSIGTSISTIAKNQQQAMLGGFMFLFPAILLSGIMFPVESMPRAIMGAAYLDPLLYFMRILRCVMLKGDVPYVFWANLGALALMAAFGAGLAYNRFKQTLN
ncbi:MAG TPA: ABC transporter permease, partial [Elusimicrobiales bacterium]|nr:ABC transporter permease [Elusimicrobiales bacterium]